MDQAFRLDGDNNCSEYVNILIKRDLSIRIFSFKETNLNFVMINDNNLLRIIELR